MNSRVVIYFREKQKVYLKCLMRIFRRKDFQEYTKQPLYDDGLKQLKFGYISYRCSASEKFFNKLKYTRGGFHEI